MDADFRSGHLLPLVRKYWLTLTLFCFGLIFLGYGLIASLNSSPSQVTFKPAEKTSGEANVSISPQIAVDVEGAVQNPGVYHLSQGDRVADALIKAGGLSANADRSQIAKTLNLAAKLTDGGKIYLPFLGEKTASNTQNTLNINTASLSDLDSLPGIGQATAQKIIENRPYASIEDLVSKKILGSKALEKIKDRLSVY